MSYVECVPVVAGADLSSGGQYKAVAIGGTIAATSTAALGILQNKPKSGEDATVAVLGRSRFVAGGAVTAGALVTVTGSGYLVATTSYGLHFARALEGVSSGGIGECVIGR